MDIDYRFPGTGRGATRYGAGILRFNGWRALAWALIVTLLTIAVPPAFAAPATILAFGDSLFAGYGLSPADGFPAQLERALRDGKHDVRVINAGVSGDTTADGVARLAWSLADKPDLVLLELGSNDALRGLDPDRARANLDTLLGQITAAHIPVVLVGMLAPRNLGPAYQAKFDPIYPDLARKYGVPLYPFILDGVALDPTLSQADGMHPNSKGVAIIVNRMLPLVEKALPSKAS